MKVKSFKYGYRSGWEHNFTIGKFTLRIAQHQVALWKNMNPIFNKLFLFAVAIALATGASAQGFFKPIPKPASAGKVGVSANPLIQNNVRPLVGVTAIFSDGTALAGGAGAGFMHNKWDEASQTWITQYSISGLAFLDTKAGVTGALVFGFLNLFSVGGGYNFTTGKFNLLTGITIKPF